MAFTEVLTSSWFKYGALPCIATGVALLMKFNSRPDARPGELEDWAVGFDLCQVSFFAMLVDGVADAVRSLSTTEATGTVKERLAELPWILCAMLVVLLLVSYVVRKAGWSRPGTPQPLPKLNKFGLIFPLLIGAVYMIGAIMWMGGNRG